MFDIKELILGSFNSSQEPMLRTQQIKKYVKENNGFVDVAFYKVLWQLENERRLERHTKFLNSEGRIYLLWLIQQ